MEQRLNNTISQITKLIFFNQKLQKADAIVVLGSSHRQLIDEAVVLYKKRWAPKIVLTGAYNPKILQIEAEWARGIAIDQGVPVNDILMETKSSNTKENAIESSKILKKNNWKKIILITKTYHARRALITFRKWAQNIEIIVHPVVDGKKITQNNWFKNKNKVKTVMGEIEKIGKYFLQGDLKI